MSGVKNGFSKSAWRYNEKADDTADDRLLTPNIEN